MNSNHRIEDSTNEARVFLISGNQTPLRRGLASFGAWLFSSPYLPGWLTWVAMLAVAFQGLFILAQQLPNFWIDPKNAVGAADIYALLSRGVWFYLGVYLLSVLFVGLLLSVLNRLIASIVWLGICFFYLDSLVSWGWCGFRPFFILYNPGQCIDFRMDGLVLISLIAGLILSTGIKLLSQNEEEGTKARAPYRALIGVSTAFFLLLGIGIVHVASAPKPEWRTLQPSHAPSARTSPTLAYDSNRKSALLFGGSSSWTASGAWIALNDTWEWNGLDWLRRQPVQSPPARLDSAMAYDPQRKVTVLFGGQDQNFIFADTWEWDGDTWHQVFPKNSPPARCSFGMYYDPNRGAVVIYGGFARQDDPATGSTKNVFFDDAWAWDGHNWSQIQYDTPRATDVFAIQYDDASGLPILMDGEGLWYWQANRWVQHDLSNEPPGRYNGRLVFDPIQRRMVLFGGGHDKQSLNDTWVFDGKSWKSVTTAASPAARYAMAMFYDETRRSFIMFGGFDGTNLYNDTWELRLP